MTREEDLESEEGPGDRQATLVATEDGKDNGGNELPDVFDDMVTSHPHPTDLGDSETARKRQRPNSPAHAPAKSPSAASSAVPTPTPVRFGPTQWLEGFSGRVTAPTAVKGKAIQPGNRPDTFRRPSSSRPGLSPPGAFFDPLPRTHNPVRNAPAQSGPAPSAPGLPRSAPALLVPTPSVPASGDIHLMRDQVNAIYSESHHSLSTVVDMFSAKIPELNRLLNLAHDAQSQAIKEMEKARVEAEDQRVKGDMSENDLRILQIRCASLSASSQSSREEIDALKERAKQDETAHLATVRDLQASVDVAKRCHDQAVLEAKMSHDWASECEQRAEVAEMEAARMKEEMLLAQMIVEEAQGEAEVGRTVATDLRAKIEELQGSLEKAPATDPQRDPSNVETGSVTQEEVEKALGMSVDNRTELEQGGFVMEQGEFGDIV